jgi:hypothetical protein
MQEVLDAQDHEAATGAGAAEAEGLLEDSRGVTWLTHNGAVIGSVTGRKSALEYESISWHQSIALRLLQGFTIPQATHGLTLVSGTHRPVWHPRPGVDGVRFAIGT